MINFQSKLAPYMIGAITEKRNNGYLYRNEEYSYKEFDTFIIVNHLDTGKFTRNIIMKYSTLKETECNNSRNVRVKKLSGLAKYMISLGLSAYIPHDFKKREKNIPYLPSKKELSTFFKCIDNFQVKTKSYIRFNLEYSIIFRLYYCCGLRRAEASNIKLEDFNLEEGIIKIICSKDKKSRLIYVDESLRLLCSKYNDVITSNLPFRKFFFPGRTYLMPLSLGALNTHFNFFWKLSNPEHNGKRPTIHCLRHCFITYKIDEWQATGVNVDAMLPYLSKYVGHSDIQQTYYYYHSLDASSPAIRKLVNTLNEAIPEVEKYEE
jgi:integrase